MRLPQEERDLRRGLSELERASQYLRDVFQVAYDGIECLVNPRHNTNLTAYSRVLVFERELGAKENAVDRQLSYVQDARTA
jgi:hypothetical protein